MRIADTMSTGSTSHAAQHNKALTSLAILIWLFVWPLLIAFLGLLPVLPAVAWLWAFGLIPWNSRIAKSVSPVLDFPVAKCR